MVAFGPPSHTRRGTDEWEKYFKSEVLEKWDAHSCLKSYRWHQEKSGWGQLLHTGHRDKNNQGATPSLQAFLESLGFRKQKTHWGSSTFDPATDKPPHVIIRRISVATIFFANVEIGQLSKRVFHYAVRLTHSSLKLCWVGCVTRRGYIGIHLVVASRKM